MTVRRALFILAALIGALVVVSVAYSQPVPPAGQQPAQPAAQPPVPQAGPQPRRGPEGGPRLAQGLQLTDEQRSRLASLVIEQRDRANLARATMQSLSHQLSAELWADKPDEAKIKQLRGDLLKAQQDLLTARFDQQAKIAQILTPEQRKKARDLRAERLLMGPGGPGAPGMGRFGRGMGPQQGGRRLRGPAGPGGPGAEQQGQVPGPGPAGRLPWWLRDDSR